MRKLFFMFFLFCFSLEATNYNSYLPLKIGNRWIYNCNLGNPYEYSHDRVSVNIIDTVTYGGFKYFTYSETIVHLQGNYHYVPDMFLFTGNYPLRIDSLNGRICYLIPGGGCSYSISDVLADSVSARINDSVFVSCTTHNFKYKCIDTTMQKYFKGNDNSNNVWERKYVPGTGFTYSSNLY